MSTRHPIVKVLVVLALAAALALLLACRQPGPNAAPVQPVQPEQPEQTAKQPPLNPAAPYPSALARETERALMAEKARLSHQLLDAIAQQDFASIEGAAQHLHQLSLRAEWEVHGAIPYQRESGAFRDALHAIAANAGRRDINAVRRDYRAVLDACMSCHAFLQEAGLAQPDGT